jgi:spore coat polysaccharide biosynthesis predicted glycosyltransferase SpsG
MRYVLRADASQSIGAGHVMRSSAIAEELIARGEDVVFVGQISDVPWLVIRINTLGFSEILSEANEFVSNPEKDVLLLDSYALPVGDDFIQPHKWRAIVTVADELTPAYSADLIIHPSFSFDLVDMGGVKVLAGAKYIPFRSSIQKIRNIVEKKPILEILVVGGGTDSTNFVAAICGALTKIQDNFHANIFTNDSALSEIDSRLTVIPIGSELDDYAMNADLVFTTASTTSLEFIAREIAVGIGCAVDNQEEYYFSLSNFGVAAPIGRFIAGNWEMDVSGISKLVNSQDSREVLRSKCAGLVDLEGAQRIVNEIIKL